MTWAREQQLGMVRRSLLCNHAERSEASQDDLLGSYATTPAKERLQSGVWYRAARANGEGQAIASDLRFPLARAMRKGPEMRGSCHLCEVGVEILPPDWGAGVRMTWWSGEGANSHLFPSPGERLRVVCLHLLLPVLNTYHGALRPYGDSTAVLLHPQMQRKAIPGSQQS